jgi:hypothetical protein
VADVTIDPAQVSLAPKGTVVFRVTGLPADGPPVTWTATEGTIDGNGNYTAPDAPGAPQATVTAAAAGSTGTATVTFAAPAASPDPAPQGPQGGTFTISPSSVLLSAKSVQQFAALDASNEAVEVTWTLVGTGSLPRDVVGGIGDTTGIYTAPADIAGERTVMVQASAKNGGTQRASVTLTPGAIRVVPAEVTLRAGEQQRFMALVQGDPHNAVRWISSPSLKGNAGKEVDPVKGPDTVFTAPDKIGEDKRLVVTAVSDATGTTGSADVLLVADPWAGPGPNVLGAWLIAVCAVVPILYGRWPPPSTAERTQMIAAQKADADALTHLQQQQSEQTRLAAEIGALTTQLHALPNDANGQQRAAALQSQVDTDTGLMPAADAAVRTALLEKQSKASALRAEIASQDDNRQDEQKLFFLVFVAGALGAFVHASRSFVDFKGNQRLRSSWTWWYILQPLTGASLAIVMYFVVRAGFFASTTGANALNPWGFVAVAAMVGLFTKQATNKLDELFSTMFRTEKDRELKDKLAR